MKKSFLLLSSTVLLMSNLFGTVYSDGTNPEDWKYYTSSKGEISTENGAISLKGNGTKSGVYLQLSPITKDASTIKWRMKFKNYFKLYVQVATNKGIRYLTYYPLNNFSKKSGRFLQIGLGKSARDDKWQTFTRDINRDLETLETGLKLREIKAFFLRGTGLIDDVEVVTHTITDTDKFKKLVRESGNTDGSKITYFPELGIGKSNINEIAYDLTFFYAFSDENKNSLTGLKISAITDGRFRASVRPLENKKLLVTYQCKYEEHRMNCLKNQNDWYHDIYKITNPLNPILISSTVVREGEP